MVELIQTVWWSLFCLECLMIGMAVISIGPIVVSKLKLFRLLTLD